jgi:propanol-preferring alcohol dehydrogenase
VRGWAVDVPQPIDGHPLVLVDRHDPEPGPHELVVDVSCCAVCRTDLHLAEGDLAPNHRGVVPGHEVVGTVIERGDDATRFAIGDRVGIAWLRWTCGACRFCTTDRENLCVTPRFTGWDADGGFAERTVIDERYAHRLPSGYDDEHVAPLLCAGIIGYRALRRAALPAGGVLGIYGFGASAHITLQVARHEGARVHVLTRSPSARELAVGLGAASVGDTYDRPPEPLDAAIVFAPAGEIVPAALAATDRGGTVAIAGIHLTDIPPLRYADHLFQERQLRSVTANTRQDATELLDLAERMPIAVTTTAYGFDGVPAALADLAHDRVDGAAVIRMR